MAEIKKYLDTTALGTLVDQIKAEDAKVLQGAKDYADGLATNYDASGAAAGALASAKEYTDALANGAVATNAADIATLKGTGEGSVAKAVADAKALVDADVDAVEAIANKNKEDIAAINDGTNGILAQAKAYADTEDEKIETEVAELTAFVGVIPEGYEATTIAAYAKELADNVAANGYDDTALAARVDKNAEDITALQAKDTELVKKDEDLQAAIDAVKEDVDAFFLDADMTESAKDTLKELQTYIASDETAASQMAASIKGNSDAIGELQTADAAQDEKIAALEAKFGGAEGSVEDMIADAKTEAINTAAGDATTKAGQALTDAKAYTDTEVDKDRARLDALELIDHDHANKAELDLIATGDKAKWDAAEAKAHEHVNAAELAKIADGDVAKWNAAEQNAKTFAQGLNDTMQGVVDGINGRVGTLETTIADKAEADDLDAAVLRIAANETAIAANTSAINSFTAITPDEVNALFA